MVDTKKLTNEIKTLLEEIYNETKSSTNEEQTKKNELRQKINNLNFNEIENLADLTFQEKATLLAAKTQLEKEKQEEKEKLDKELADTKEALATLKEKVSDKLTPELMTKLATIANKNLELKRIPKKTAKKDADGKEVKDSSGNVVYEDLKDEQGNIIYEEVLDLTKIENALEALKTQKPITPEIPTNYWIIGACLTDILSLTISFFNLMSNKSKLEKEELEKENTL